MDEKKFAGTPAETDKAEAVRGEALSDEELDTVAGGWTDGVEGNDRDSDRGYRHEYRGGNGIVVATYFTCRVCGGPIIPDARYPHDCPGKKIPIR